MAHRNDLSSIRKIMLRIIFRDHRFLDMYTKSLSTTCGVASTSSSHAPCSHPKDLVTKLFYYILLLKRLSKVCSRLAILILQTTPTYVQVRKWLLRSAFFQYNVYKWHDDLPSANKHIYYLKLDCGGTKTILGPAGAQ